MGIDLAVKVFDDFLLVSLFIHELHSALATLGTAAAAALELFIGVQRHHQKSADLSRRELLVGLELAIGVDQNLAPILQPITFQDIAQAIIADGLLQANEVLPAPAVGFGFSLQQGRQAQDAC